MDSAINLGLPNQPLTDDPKQFRELVPVYNALKILQQAIGDIPVSAIKSIQRGTITLTGVTTNTAIVTAVDVTKSMLLNLGCSYGSTTDLSNALAYLTLTNSTTITATRASAGAQICVVSYELIEFE